MEYGHLGRQYELRNDCVRLSSQKGRNPLPDDEDGAESAETLSLVTRVIENDHLEEGEGRGARLGPSGPGSRGRRRS